MENISVNNPEKVFNVDAMSPGYRRLISVKDLSFDNLGVILIEGHLHTEAHRSEAICYRMGFRYYPMPPDLQRET
jgi:hypothetical protein